MVLVDTSIWIELLNKKLSKTPSDDDLRKLCICPPIVQEILQGIAEPQIQARLATTLLALERVGDPLAMNTFLSAADIFSTGRRKGLTIRSSFDCLIAAIAIENRIAVWHRDRDFTVIARFTSLKTVNGIE